MPCIIGNQEYQYLLFFNLTFPAEDTFLTHEEIRAQALEDRKKRARSEQFNVTRGDMFKGEHLVETPAGRQYTVIFHDPEAGLGHCSCPDFATNKLNTCNQRSCVEKA